MNKSKSFSYISEIDGLRAVAVVLVLLNHIYEPLAYNGFLGVDLFFVISGFVITRSLLSHSIDGLSLFCF